MVIDFLYNLERLKYENYLNKCDSGWVLFVEERYLQRLIFYTTLIDESKRMFVKEKSLQRLIFYTTLRDENKRILLLNVIANMA